MKMNDVFIIGELKTAVYYDADDNAKAVRLKNNQLVDCTHNLAFLLDIPAEKRALKSVTSEAQLIAELHHWHARHSLLDLLISGMDKDFSRNTRLDCVQRAEHALKRPELADFVAARLLGCPFAEAEADLNTAIELAAELPQSLQIYQAVQRAAPHIKDVIESFKNAYQKPYEGTEVARTCVDSGLMKTAVLAAADKDKKQIDALIFDKKWLTELIKQIPEARNVLTHWHNSLIKRFISPQKTEQ